MCMERIPFTKTDPVREHCKATNYITRIQIVSKVLIRDLLNTKLKFLVPLSIYIIQSSLIMHLVCSSH